MATPAQIAANQANAQKSTGPRTEDGKSATRANAVRHGMCASIFCVFPDEQELCDSFLADLMDEHQPQGLTEQVLVYKMAEQFVLTKRAGTNLAVASASGDAKQIALSLRYYNAADRAFNKNLSDLRKLQKERRLSEIGFVSQNDSQPSAPAKPTPVEPEIPAPGVENSPVCVTSAPAEPPINCSDPQKRAA
jgi:hypothetical protein